MVVCKYFSTVDKWASKIPYFPEKYVLCKETAFWLTFLKQDISREVSANSFHDKEYINISREMFLSA